MLAQTLTIVALVAAFGLFVSGFIYMAITAFRDGDYGWTGIAVVILLALAAFVAHVLEV